MGFFTERCPNCGKSISKNAQHCNHCGCPSSTAWANCQSCGTSVGADSKFCWKCGTEQNATSRVKFYGDRWRRSGTDFAARVELNTPEKVLHHGLQVDEGTLALVFQNGRLLGSLAPGYHTFDNVLQRVLGLDKGKYAHAVLLDMRSAEVDFAFSGLQVADGILVDARARLYFQITEPTTFVGTLVGEEASTFTTEDLSTRFQAEVRDALQAAITALSLDDLLILGGVRSQVEEAITAPLQSRLAPFGIAVAGLRLVDFHGAAVENARTKLGELAQLNREFELNRRLEEALRREKVEAFRSDEEASDYYAKITDEYGLRDAEREEKKKRWMQAAENQTQIEGLQLDYRARRQEILHRLDEQALVHKSDHADLQAKLEQDRLRYTGDLARDAARFDQEQEHRLRKAATDKQIAEQGIDTLVKLKEAKHGVRRKEDAHELEVEARRLQIRGDANLQALLSTLTGEQADRLLKFAELEMRKGLTAEQALAMVAEKSPEISPAVAEALRARYGGTREG